MITFDPVTNLHDGGSAALETLGAKPATVAQPWLRTITQEVKERSPQ
jgi:hypothetical protein